MAGAASRSMLWEIVVLSKDRGRLFVHLLLQTPQKCIVESSLSCTILPELRSAQPSLKSKAMACSGK